MRKKTKDGLLGLCLTGALALNGCNTPQGRALARSMGSQIMYGAADEYVRGEIRKTQGHQDYRNENNEPQNRNSPQTAGWGVDGRLPEYNLQEIRNQISSRLRNVGILTAFTYERYVDLNGNGIFDIEEFDIKRNFKPGRDVAVAAVIRDGPIGASLFSSGSSNNITLDIEVVNNQGEAVMKDRLKDVIKKLGVYIMGGKLVREWEPGFYRFKLKMGNSKRKNPTLDTYSGAFQVLDN